MQDLFRNQNVGSFVSCFYSFFRRAQEESLCRAVSNYTWSLNMEVPIIINHQIKSKKAKKKMESNITKILIKKRFWKRCVNSWQREMALTFWCSLSPMILPSEAQPSSAPPPSHKEKNVSSLRALNSHCKLTPELLYHLILEINVCPMYSI